MNEKHLYLAQVSILLKMIYTCSYMHVCISVTLLVEIQDKDITSHKAKSPLQFGTNIYMIGLSLTSKSIK